MLLSDFNVYYCVNVYVFVSLLFLRVFSIFDWGGVRLYFIDEVIVWCIFVVW